VVKLLGAEKIVFKTDFLLAQKTIGMNNEGGHLVFLK
jgi:hypothetical protein